MTGLVGFCLGVIVTFVAFVVLAWRKAVADAGDES